MKSKSGLCVSVSLWFVFLCALAGCNSGSNTAAPVSSAPNRVVLYCSVDDVYARPIIKKLEEQTGLRIDVIYDTEAAKTAGLANRIRAERNRRRGDVFWSSALLQTLLLSREGLLQPYQSPSARDIPKHFKDPRGVWTGLGVRARVIVHHGDISMRPIPGSLQDLLDSKLVWSVGISNPQFGTGSDWVAALAARWGVPKTLSYFRALKKNGVRVLPGNSVVAQRVGRGEIDSGITDTDDYLAQKRRSEEIEPIDDNLWERRLKRPRLREPKTINAVLVPGSVAIMKNAPHPAAARRLVDALLAAEAERLLARQMPGVLPLRDMRKSVEWRFGDDVSAVVLNKHNIPDDTARWPAAWDKVREPLAEILLGK